MARPKKIELSPETASAINELPVQSAAEIQTKAPAYHLKSSVAHMAIGIDLLASKTTLEGKKGNLYVTPIGLLAHSSKNNRNVVIPYANIKGFELPGGDPVKIISYIKEMFVGFE